MERATEYKTDLKDNQRKYLKVKNMSSWTLDDDGVQG